MTPAEVTTARRLFEVSRPLSPEMHLVESGAGWHLLLPNGNRLFDLDHGTYSRFDAARRSGDLTTIEALLGEAGLDLPPLIDDAPVAEPAVRALSLAGAQKCHLGCTPRYAQPGSLGGPARRMP